MSDLRKAFTEAIIKDPYEQSARLMFADWLDCDAKEQDLGRPGDEELSATHRRWTPEIQKSEEWLRDYIQQMQELSDKGREFDLTYESLLNAAHSYVDNGDCHILSFDTPDFAGATRKEFWKHFENVTGRVVDDDVKDDHIFRCAC